MTERLPQPTLPLPDSTPIARLRRGSRLVRIYDPARGSWSDRRFYGPIPDVRFDHQPPPPSVHDTRSVWYGTTRLRGAVAETFGRSGLVDLDGLQERRLAEVEVRGRLALVDLVGASARRFGLTQEIGTSTDYAATQAWARAFYEAYPQLQGIRWRGRQAGSICVLLTDRADTVALRLLGNWRLDQAEARARILRAARDCSIAVV